MAPAPYLSEHQGTGAGRQPVNCSGLPTTQERTLLTFQLLIQWRSVNLSILRRVEKGTEGHWGIIICIVLSWMGGGQGGTGSQLWVTQSPPIKLFIVLCHLTLPISQGGYHYYEAGHAEGDSLRQLWKGDWGLLRIKYLLWVGIARQQVW